MCFLFLVVSLSFSGSALSWQRYKSGVCGGGDSLNWGHWKLHEICEGNPRKTPSNRGYGLSIGQLKPGKALSGWNSFTFI